MRILQLDQTAETPKWTPVREFSLDWQYGAEREHMRRQIYSLTVTKIAAGLWFAMWNVLEWPKQGCNGCDMVRIYGGTSTAPDRGFVLDWIYAGQPLVATGMGGSAFDSGSVLSASRLVTTDSAHWIFYEASTRSHEQRFAVGESNTIAAAKFDLDSLWGLRPTDELEWGSITTQPMLVTAETLSLRAYMSPGGSMLAALYDAELQEAVEGFGCGQSNCRPGTTSGDVICSWSHASVAALRGQVVHLQVRLYKATLHAFHL